MFDVNYMIGIIFRIWIALFIGMILRTIIRTVIEGVRNGYRIATIKQNVNKKIIECDEDLKKYYNYEVETDDISDMYEQSERE